MKRPNKTGYYWVKIPHHTDPEVVLVIEDRDHWTALRAGNGQAYGLTHVKDWRWLGRAILEKEA